MEDHESQTFLCKKNHCRDNILGIRGAILCLFPTEESLYCSTLSHQYNMIQYYIQCNTSFQQRVYCSTLSHHATCAPATLLILEHFLMVGNVGKFFTFFRKGTKSDIYKYITYMCILNRPKSLKTQLFFNRLHGHPPPQFCFTTRAVYVAKENSLPDDSFSSSTSPSASTQPPFFLVARHLRLVYHWWW